MYDLRYRTAERAPSLTAKIWEWYYRCMVPALQSRSVEDIRERGVIVTGIKDLDEGLKNDWVLRDMTINQMVDLFKKGVSVRVIKDADVKDIYDTIQTHLTLWVEHIRTGLNVRDAPIDDLVFMDRFAGAVYPHAKYLFTPEALGSVLGEEMMRLNRVTLHNFFEAPKKPADGKVVVEPEDPKIPARESFENRFKQSITTFGRFE